MDHIRELCTDLKLDEMPAKSKEGAYRLSIYDQLAIDVTPLDPGSLFFSPISPCPKQKKEELFIHLMKANFFGQGTLGSVIALDSEQSLLTLSYHIPYDEGYRAFREAFEDFANIVEYWRGEIALHVERAEGGIL